MITLYYDLSNTSCRRATQWLKDQGIAFNAKRMEEMTREDLLNIMALTESGFIDVLKCPNRTKKRLKAKISYVMSLSFNEAVEYILLYPEVLKTPLIFEGNKFNIGYNAEEMRVFVPRENRKLKMRRPMI